MGNIYHSDVVRVTKEDIENGEPENANCCAVALDTVDALIDNKLFIESFLTFVENETMDDRTDTCTPFGYDMRGATPGSVNKGGTKRAFNHIKKNLLAQLGVNINDTTYRTLWNFQKDAQTNHKHEY